MITRLDRTLKRELTVDGRAFVVAISPEELKLTRKGGRKGVELRWIDLISGDAALAAALNASVGRLDPGEPPRPAKPPKPARSPKPGKSATAPRGREPGPAAAAARAPDRRARSKRR